jgi:hypothetical protein
MEWGRAFSYERWSLGLTEREEMANDLRARNVRTRLLILTLLCWLRVSSAALLAGILIMERR